MGNKDNGVIVDSLTLRFAGETDRGVAVHDLRAAHVAEVLQGLVALTSDFDKAGVFDYDGPSGSEIMVRPAREGSFVLEVVRVVSENWESAATVLGVAGVPSLASIIWWATKSMRADVKDIAYLENGNVKILWQDDTVDEVPDAAWRELQKRRRRRKKQLRQIMTPIADHRVTTVDVQGNETSEVAETDEAAPPDDFVLTRTDYEAVRPEDEIVESFDIFEVEAQMSAIDFDDPTRWRVRTKERTRSATVEDQDFLDRVTRGLAIRKTDIFRLKVRQDTVEKNGQTRTSWTVLHVESHRRAADDSDPQS